MEELPAIKNKGTPEGRGTAEAEGPNGRAWSDCLFHLYRQPLRDCADVMPRHGK